ncbi:MAG: cobalamin-dependent protein, partial [Gemmatimonadaceae bacterium]
SVLGIPLFLEAVGAPLLRRIGDEWHAGRLTPAQEHLATAAVQRVVAGAMIALPAPAGAPTIVIATLAGERHEIGAVLAAAAAAAEGWRVIYLGADLPAGEIAAAALGTRADAVGVSIIFPADRERVLDELRALRTLLPASTPLLVGGAGAGTLAPQLTELGARVVADLPGLGATLHDVGAAKAA